MTSSSTPAAVSSIPTAIPVDCAATLATATARARCTIINSTGGGITELAGTNTYTGGTTVTNTTLQVTNNASVGTGTVTLDERGFRPMVSAAT